MRKISQIFITIIIGVVVIQHSTESSTYKEEIQKWQQEQNSEFKDTKTSPLTADGLASFEKLHFYDIDEDYKIEASLELNKNQKEFGMKTTTARLPVYVKYGVASFSIKGQSFSINIYQNVEFAKQEKYEDFLFMLFTDNTSGITSYAGGKYIDLRIPKEGEKLLIDFNKSYNPYCAYNHKYSCPIPPDEDHLNIEIKAGVKAYH